MAGLAGVVSQLELTSGSLLEKMAESLKFSANDEPEYWHDAHAAFCRVRVGIDNPDPQPIFSKDKEKCIAFFGECFGHDGLKRKLVRDGYNFDFDNNDAEFVLRLYEAYGESALSQLSGSFCFVIYDRTMGELLAVNDRLGTRPLFYGTTPDGKLIFATQVAAVLCASGISRELDVTAVVEFCALQRVLGEKTYHRGVRMLKPASMLRYSAGALEIGSYWFPEYNPQSGTLNEYAEELAAIMRCAMSHVTRGDGRVAMLLSGGLDARMAVAAAGGRRLVCYTFGDYDNPEVQTARRIAETGKCEFHFLRRDPDHYVKMVDTAVDIGNGMHAFNHAHPLGAIESIARECDVVTHGFVPELLFRGYSLPKAHLDVLGVRVGSRLDPTLSAANLPERLYRRGYSLLGRGVEGLFAPEIRGTLEETLQGSAREMIAEAKVHATDVYDQFLWPDVYYHARYPSMLFELSLRHFMTERSLVFHNDVLELHLKLPLHLRADKRLWLAAMKRLNADVARVTDANTGYSPFLPTFAVSSVAAAKNLGTRLPLLWRLVRGADPSDAQRAQRGLSPKSWPRFDWMIRNNAKLRELMIDTLGDPEALPPEVFDRGSVQALLQDHLANRAHHRMMLFTLLTFGRWHKRYAGI